MDVSPPPLDRPGAAGAASAETAVGDARIHALVRPHRNLLTYYTVMSLTAGPFFPIVWLVNYFRYQTMQYRFDVDGVTMRWGILFRREVILNYARIQDIQIVSNLLERWLGLGRVQIQTASGSALPEMTIEGFFEYEAIRSFLYARMRGTRDSADGSRGAAPSPGEGSTRGPAGGDAELAGVLREIARELREWRGSMAGVRREALARPAEREGADERSA